VWGCLSSGSCKNILKKLEGRLDTKQYKELLSENVVPFYQGSPFVHDFFPVHTAVSVREFLKCNSIAVLNDWPKKSGDIMPLETVWLYIVDKLKDSNILAFDTDSLWSELLQLWSKLSVDGYFCQIISKMPQRLQKLIDRDGNWIRANV
jgi:hypothetical protein